MALRSFCQIMRQTVSASGAELGIGRWRRLNTWLCNLPTLRQFLMLRLHLGRALRLEGGTLPSNSWRNCVRRSDSVLAHLNLAFDL